ncbi:urea ABC transporter permease subunit UrtC [Yinghuangia seranimata]|uniref:urea ABC transporter permease subunit UrtC n=1 Tax=Yinghuangia seranimata TaxID=408067 RepID=UPI00248B14EC|nr:urea ABC transporter permease subunit UrtC [Yinghuangia seranimata]MDI2130456.1 urea ABC transporter permease subunit UrtC [Yinghuangia seranimata]
MRRLREAADAVASAAVRWRGPVVFVAVALLLLVAAPAALSPFRLELLAKYLCFAIAALGIGLAWGKGGMLTLGQGVFFGLGGYAMAMHLKLAEAGPGQLPDFMVWSGVETLPAVWEPFRQPWFALLMVVVLPGVTAFLLGLLVFGRRVRGAYFAILTQALAAAFVIWLVGQQGLTGGTNGLTNFTSFFGLDLADENDQRVLYSVVAVVLGLLYLAFRQVVASRFGRLLVAVRDGEDRVRFLGYDPALVKTVAFTLSAISAGIAGALFVPVVGIISPALLGVVPSLEFVFAVAVGGRYTLAGAVLGAVLLNYGKTTFSEHYANGWLYLQGTLFIAVMAYAPKGVIGVAGQVRDFVAARRGRAAPAVVPPARVEEGAAA